MRLDVAVEHRGVGAQAKFVGRAVDLEPGLGVGLARADLRADLRVEDFGPAAGHAPSPAAINSSRIDRTGRLVIWAKWSISTAVHAFRCRRGKAACKSRVMPRYQSNVLSDARRRRCATRCNRPRPPTATEYLWCGALRRRRTRRHQIAYVRMRESSWTRSSPSRAPLASARFRQLPSTWQISLPGSRLSRGRHSHPARW